MNRRENVWTEFVWLRTHLGSCEHANESLYSLKCGIFLD
jgi:hypothetical protein